MWNSLITPQPNKYIEILMPNKPIPKTVEILINDEAWYLVDYDKVSVPGIIYMSFTESKVNALHDNIEKEIANYDKIVDIQIKGIDTIQANIGDEIIPEYTIYLDGIPNKDVQPEIFISGDLSTDGEKITVHGDGKVIIQYKNVTFEQSIITGESELQAILDGPEKLRVTQSATYEIVANFPFENIEFTLSNNLASIVSYSGNSCVIKGNDKNKIGDVILTAIVDNITLTKTIQIISLWQVI